jgi:hypothetical protein
METGEIEIIRKQGLYKYLYIVVVADIKRKRLESNKTSDKNG